MLRIDWVQKAEMEMEALRKAAETELQRIKFDFPMWPTNDVRHWSLIRLSTETFLPVLGLYIMRTHLSHVEWWERYATGAGHSLIETGRTMFDKTIKGKLVLDLVGNLEHSFRILLRHIDPTNETHKFAALCTTLFRATNPYLHTIPADWQPPLDILRRARNCVHNAWLYEPDNGKPFTTVFRGHTVSFVVGQPVECFSWDILTALCTDVLRILLAVIRDEKISCFPAIADVGAGASWSTGGRHQ